MDYTKLNDINYYVKYSVEDTEGFDFDGGEKYGGTTILYFPTKHEVDMYAGLPCIGDRKKLYGVSVMDYEKGDVKSLTIYHWDGTPVTEEEIKGQTILMLYDRIDNGRDINYAADMFRRYGASEVYAYTSWIDTDVLDRNTDQFMDVLDNGVVGELFTKDVSLYDKHNRITLIDQPFYDYFDE